jgi:hypothetical protein
LIKPPARIVIDRDQIAWGKKRLTCKKVSSIGGFETCLAPLKRIKPIPSGTGRDAVSAVRLTAAVDAWAEAHGTARSDAIRQLVELGLSATPPVDPLDASRCDSVEIEDLAAKQIGDLLDPSLPSTERERRIRRLTEGPPEFLDRRVDLPKPKK